MIGETSVFPASLAQERVWLLDQVECPGSADNESCAFRLRGSVDTQILDRSFNEVVRRHDALRTSFAVMDERPVQVVAARLAVPLSIFDLSACSDSERATREARIIANCCGQPFALDKLPLIRHALIILTEIDHIYLLVAHRSIVDGWSIRVLLRELSALYTADAMGQPSPLSPPPMQYSDFAVWQRRWLKGEIAKQRAGFWERRLADAPSSLDLPSIGRPTVRTFHGTRRGVLLPTDLVQVVQDLSREAEVSVSTVLLTAFQVLLARYSAQDDIVVGTPAERPGRIEAEGLLGPVLNTLVLRTNLSDDPPVRELFQRTQALVSEASRDQDFPFEQLIERLGGERDPSRTSIFQVQFVFQEPIHEALTLPGVTVQPFPLDGGTTRFDLTLSLSATSRAIEGFFEYNTDRFDSATIERMVASYLAALQAMPPNARSPISALPLLDEQHIAQLRAWSTRFAGEPDNRGLSALFEEQVARTPDALALIHGDARLTFRELNYRANQLARRLGRLGVATESIVALCAERSIEMIVAIFGILKAGGAYLPLDPGLPTRRLSAIIDEAMPTVILAQGNLVVRLPTMSAPLLHLDERDAIDRESGENLAPMATADNLAYVLYSSGSTGAPKGVLGIQRGVINRLRWMWEMYPYRQGEVACQKTAFNWVSSTGEIFGPLLQGCPLVLIPPDELSDPDRFVRTLGAHGVTRIFLVPSLLQMLLDSVDDLRARLPALEHWSTAGEPLSVELSRRFHARMPGCVLVNVYGITEASSGVIYYETLREEAGPTVPIGRPIHNTAIYVANHRCQLSPIGVPGELYIGGAPLARGYLKRPDLTADRFIANPFDEWVRGRVFRTGDVVRWRPDGNLEYLGRLDRQVKIRGQRVELAEIEATLRQHPGVRECVVDQRAIDRTGGSLAAYVVAEHDPAPDRRDLWSFLAERLPAYMVPSEFVLLDRLPLTFNGKVDRKALPAPDPHGPESEDTYVAPRSALERALTRIWGDALGARPIGVRDDFFRLGGHSLVAVRMLAEVARQLGTTVTLSRLLPEVTIERLARLIERNRESRTESSVVPIQPLGFRPPLFCVHGLGGGVADYSHLAAHLGPDQPVFGLPGARVDRSGQALTEIEQMARYAVEQLRGVQAVGPYRLIGHSLGGVLAFEMARQLEADGQDVALLVLIDTVAPGSDYDRVTWRPATLAGFLQNLPYWLLDFFGLGPRGMLARSRRVARAHFRRIRAWLGRGRRGVDRVRLDDILDDLTGISDDLQGFMVTQLEALRSYRPEPYSGRVILIRARRQPLFCSFDPTLGWQRWTAGGVTVRLVPGNHVKMVIEEAPSEALAERLKPFLEQRA